MDRSIVRSIMFVHVALFASVISYITCNGCPYLFLSVPSIVGMLSVTSVALFHCFVVRAAVYIWCCFICVLLFAVFVAPGFI